MDHKVSKDMISSGMIPSGEKTQADLGKTQYGSAPSPSKLMDAYKSMYDKKEEVINEMKMGDVSGSADFASRNIKGAKGAAPAPKPTPKTETTAADRPKPKTETDKMLDKVSDRRVEKAVNRDKDVRRARASYIMTKYGESVDLLAAYRSVYEHHKKDADGNTIPHEGEEVKEEKDMFDSILEHYLNEGYQREDILKAMSSLSEEPLTLAAIGGLLAKGGAMAAKGAAVAGKVAAKGGAMAAKGLASAGKTVAANVGKAAKGIASAGKNVAQTVKSNVSSGLNKPFNPKVTQGPKPAPMQGPRQANFGDKLKNVGRGVKDFYKSKDVSTTDKILATTTAMDVAGRFGGAMKPRGLQKADTDLFDIVKGQLLDEGLSEEEIKDIMLTLTPDEIMEELSDIVKRNDAINKANAMKAAQERKVPDKVREASKRQYTAGGPKDKGENKYTTQDKKTIIDYNKNKGSM